MLDVCLQLARSLPGSARDQAGAASAFASTSAFTVAPGAVLDLASFNQTIGSLAGAGSVTLGTGALTTNGGLLA